MRYPQKLWINLIPFVLMPSSAWCIDYSISSLNSDISLNDDDTVTINAGFTTTRSLKTFGASSINMRSKTITKNYGGAFIRNSLGSTVKPFAERLVTVTNARDFRGPKFIELLSNVVALDLSVVGNADIEGDITGAPAGAHPNNIIRMSGQNIDFHDRVDIRNVQDFLLSNNTHVDFEGDARGVDGTVTIPAGSSFDVEDDADFQGTGTINVSGSLFVSAGADLEDFSAINIATGGFFSIRDRSSSSLAGDAFDIGTITNDGKIELQEEADLTVTTIVNNNEIIVEDDADITVDTVTNNSNKFFIRSGGDVNVTTSFVNNASLTVVDGADITGAGVFTNNAAGTVILNDSLPIDVVNNGTVTLNTSETFTQPFTHNAGAMLNGAGTMINNSTFTINGDIDARVRNQGTMNIASAAESTKNIIAASTGTLNINAPLTMTGAALDSHGATNIDALLTGTLNQYNGNISLDANITGNVTMQNSAGNFNIDTPATISGSFTKSAGTLNITNALTLGSLTQTGGTTNLSTDLTTTVTNSGIFNVTAPSTISETFTNNSGGTLTLNDTLNLGLNTVENMASATFDVNAAFTGNLINDGSAYLASTVTGFVTNKNYMEIDGTTTVSSTFENRGTLHINEALSLGANAFTATTGAITNLNNTLTAGSITNDGVFNFDTAFSGNFTNQSEGVLNLNQALTGTLTNAGRTTLSSTVSGNVTNSGTLTTALDDSFGGDITNNAGGIIHLNNTSNLGANDITNNANATLNINAGLTANELTNNGTVNLNDTFSGTVTNNANLVMSGNIVGDVTGSADSRIEQIGNRTITGNYTNAGTHKINFSNFDTHEKLIVDGTINLDGVTLEIGSVTGALPPGIWYPDGAFVTDIMEGTAPASATGAVGAGTISRYYGFDVIPNGNNIQLSLARLPYGGFAITKNSENVAKVIDDGKGRFGSDFINILTSIDAVSFTNEKLSESLEGLSPTVDGSVLASSFSAQRASLGVIDTRTQNIRVGAIDIDSGLSAGGSIAGDQSLWGQVFGSKIQQERRDNVEGWEAKSSGFALGYDRRITPDVLLGFAVSFAETDVETRGFPISTLDVNSLQGTVYGSFVDAGAFVDWAASISTNNYDSRRRVFVNEVFDRTAVARYDGIQPSLKLITGMQRQGPGVHWIPTLSVYYSLFHQDEYSETGAGDISLMDVKADNTSILELGLGVKMLWSKSYFSKDRNLPYLSDEIGHLTPEFHIEYVHDAIGSRASMSSHFQGGGAAFETLGPNPPKNGVNVGFSVGGTLRSSIQAVLSYEFEKRSNYQEQQGSATVRWLF